MITAAVLLGYAAGAAWCAPALLTPLTRRGTSVRAGLAAWLAAMASVLVSAAAALVFSLQAVAVGWPRLTQDLCRSVAGQACTPQVYGSTLYQAGAALLAVALTLASAVALGRYGRRVRRSRAQTRCHARTALLVGHAIAGPAARGPGRAGPGPAGRRKGGRRVRTVMLDDPRPAAYCVAGRPAAIVVTSGALAVLDPPQLRAVLAHEDAHLAQGHHALATVIRGLAAALPGVPLFTRGAGEVARLAEMSADDTAARASGRPALAAALLAIVTGAAFPTAGLTAPGSPRPRRRRAGPAAPVLPAGSLPAAASAVPDRVERLLRSCSPAHSAGYTAALALALALLAAAPLALTVLTGLTGGAP